jgi:hypothetical protein
LVVVATLTGVAQLFDADRARVDDPGVRRIRQGAAAVADYLDRERLERPLVYVSQSTWGDVAGIVLMLQKSNRPPTIEPNWLFMFGQPFAPTGAEDTELVFADSVRRRSLVQDSRYTTVAEWPELSIHAARIAARTN